MSKITSDRLNGSSTATVGIKRLTEVSVVVDRSG